MSYILFQVINRLQKLDLFFGLCPKSGHLPNIQYSTFDFTTPPSWLSPRQRRQEIAVLQAVGQVVHGSLQSQECFHHVALPNTATWGLPVAAANFLDVHLVNADFIQIMLISLKAR